MILQSLLLQGPKLLPHPDVELRATDFCLDTCRSFSHRFPLPFIPHTWYHFCLSITEGNTKHVGVGAKSQPQPWIRDLAHGMDRYLHAPGTEKPKLREWFRVNETHTNNQHVSIRPDLENKFERYCFISDLKVYFLRVCWLYCGYSKVIAVIGVSSWIEEIFKYPKAKILWCLCRNIKNG